MLLSVCKAVLDDVVGHLLNSQRHKRACALGKAFFLAEVRCLLGYLHHIVGRGNGHVQTVIVGCAEVLRDKGEALYTEAAASSLDKHIYADEYEGQTLAGEEAQPYACNFSEAADNKGSQCCKGEVLHDRNGKHQSHTLHALIVVFECGVKGAGHQRQHEQPQSRYSHIHCRHILNEQHYQRLCRQHDNGCHHRAYKHCVFEHYSHQLAKGGLVLVGVEYGGKGEGHRRHSGAKGIADIAHSGNNRICRHRSAAAEVRQQLV